MFFNKSVLPLVFTMLLVAGLAFVATPATAVVTPVLSVTDVDEDTAGIQVYGIRTESVPIELTVTFQDAQDANAEVTGFGIDDIELIAADSSDKVVLDGATATSVSANAAGSVYTVTITAKGDIDRVRIDVKRDAARTPGRLVGPNVVGLEATAPADPIVVNIVRSAAPPLTLSDDMSISGQAPFTVTLTSTKAITLTRTDIDVKGGYIPTDGLSSDTTKKVWTVTIVPGPSVEAVIVDPTPTGAYIFRKGTYTVGPQTIRQGSVRNLKGKVTISEIMFATDEGVNEIQWIEIFNSSDTETVSLDADDGWELIIENYSDPEWPTMARFGTINFKNKGEVKTIPPNQTVLIVSARGRNSDTNHFAATRVFRVYTELAAEFGMNSRRDPFLNPSKGFHIQLVDGKNELADRVGNLDGRTRTSDKPAWQLPNGWTKNGDRTSIIRRYSAKGIGRDGTQRKGWVPAAETKFSYLSKKKIENWYGISSDYGTPGIHAGGALPVQLSHFRPERTEAGTVIIKWTTESEVDNAGFNILRSQTKTGEFKTVNAHLIPGAGTAAERNTYIWTDTTAEPNVVYYYQIEDVSFAGERQTLATSRLKGIISAKDKLTTRWSELKK
ncbi:MAG: lamin tail domain-containing protein [Candidatus Poribacteria bacterium]|nr:lamin tail domain-containing protein [Candidatus Poribacteria bacterium]